MSSSETIHELVERLAVEVVLTDASDLSSLGDVRQLLEQVKGCASEADESSLVDTVEGAIALVDEITKGDGGEASTILERIADVIGELQFSLADGTRGQSTDEDGDEFVDDPILSGFLEEQVDNIEEIEALVLAIESDEKEEDFDALKRKVHTLKGEAGFLGLTDVSALCHSMEDAFLQNLQTTDSLMEAVDWLRSRFDAIANGATSPAPPDLTKAKAASTEVAESAPAPTEAPAEDGGFTDHLAPIDLSGDLEMISEFVVESREHLEESEAKLLVLENDPSDTDAIGAVFRAFHTIKGVAAFLDLDCIQHLAHEAETVLDQVRSGDLELSSHVMDATIASNDALRQLLDGIEEALGSTGKLIPNQAISELLRTLAAIQAGELSEASSRPSAPSETPVVETPVVETPVVETPVVETPVAETPVAETPVEAKAETGSADASDAPATSAGKSKAKSVKIRETIKVDSERLNELVDTIGELVIAEAMVVQSDELQLEGTSRLPGLLTHMDKITRELQAMTMSLRMVPVRATFRRMTRLARDVAQKLGKQIEFVTQGEDTALDKTVVDAIGDPLVHMVRNAVDHGMEANGEIRTAAGKPAIGRIELRAFHRGGSIHIEIEDDGPGLDPEVIIAKAIEKGMITSAEGMTEQEIYDLILQPGFSTAKVVTDVSGRGVGMDVLKRDVEALRGRVEMRSALGKGSTFCIRLPLTLAIIDGMVVRVSGQRFILPTLSIVRMIRPDAHGITQVLGRGDMVQVGEDLVPLFRLDRLFDLPDSTRDLSERACVILEHDDRLAAFIVDELIGQQQIVIKPLGAAFTGAQGLAGGAVMPDGSVGLILDMAGLLKVAESHDGERDADGPLAEELPNCA